MRVGKGVTRRGRTAEGAGGSQPVDVARGLGEGPSGRGHGGVVEGWTAVQVSVAESSRTDHLVVPDQRLRGLRGLGEEPRPGPGRSPPVTRP